MFLYKDYNLLVMVAIFVLRFCLIAGIAYFIFYVWKRKEFIHLKLNQKQPDFIQLKTELLYSAITLLIYSISFYLLIYWYQKGYTQIYFKIGTFGYAYFFLSILMMVLIHDAYFYWSHKLMHQLPFLFRFHKIHHFSHNPNPWSAFSFHPVEAIISLGIMPIILFTLPVHPYALIVFSTVVVVYNVYIHLGYNIKFLFMGSALRNTAQNHDLHHRVSKYNYGLYFSFWDRIMKTYK
ncbi:sterol desaturase family protein [Flavobacterium sp.]|uniref:sterol desaturase family protein n=1 Tax=Flavobacterium sp. TaxID=239 RepID=UPI0025E84FCA|nr:sterol desaturase family protein [Flavobacterium sp.]